MKVEFEHNLETLYEVTRQRLATFSTSKWIYRLGFLLGPLFGFLLSKIGVAKVEINDTRCTVFEVYITIVACSLIWFFIWPVFCRLFRQVWIKALYTDIAERGLASGKGYIELKEEGVLWKGVYIDQFLKWEVFEEIYETSDYLYLEHLYSTFLWVPKLAFRDKTEMATFLKFAENHVPKKK